MCHHTLMNLSVVTPSKNLQFLRGTDSEYVDKINSRNEELLRGRTAVYVAFVL